MNELILKAIEKLKERQNKRFASLKNELKTLFEIKIDDLKLKLTEFGSKVKERLNYIEDKLENVDKKIITKHSDLDDLGFSNSGHYFDEDLNLRDFKIKNLKDPIDEKDAVNVKTLIKYVSDQISKINIPVYSGGINNEKKDYTIKTTNYDLTNNDEQKVIYMNSDGGELTARLPANPNDKDIFIIKNVGSNDVIIDRNGNDIERLAENQTLSKFSKPTAKLQYTNSLGWFLI